MSLNRSLAALVLLLSTLISSGCVNNGRGFGLDNDKKVFVYSDPYYGYDYIDSRYATKDYRGMWHDSRNGYEIREMSLRDADRRREDARAQAEREFGRDRDYRGSYSDSYRNNSPDRHY